MRRFSWFTAMLILSLPARVRATQLPGSDLAALSANLRGLMTQFLPNPLYEDGKHWGAQKAFANGITWRGQGIHVHPETQYKLKNHGTWWRVKVTSTAGADAVGFELRDLKQVEPGRATFAALVALNTDVDYERQIWDEGIRLYSADVRGRLRVVLTLQCEVTWRLEAKAKGLPEIVFRLRVVNSDFRYGDLVVEHIAGLGGEAAKVLGETVRASVRLWHPSLEKRLLEKANAAILKSGDTKEVHISLSKILGK